MNLDPTQDDIDQLRRDFPQWDISGAWVTRVSEPDFYLLVAARGGLRLGAFSAAEAERVMIDAEARYGWPRLSG